MKYIKDLISFIKIIIKQRYVIFQLTKRDFQNKYLASYLGLPWAFIQPAVTILVMWVVVSLGFKAGPTNTGVPFGPWLVCGLVPWFFISDSILGGTGALMEYSYLIKKIYFRPSIIPIIKILTALVIHLFFIAVLAVFAIGYGYNPGIYWLQVPYYLFATIILVLGICWFTASVTVFMRDMGQLVGVTMQIFFWVTPIIWHESMLQGKLRYMIYMNPFSYITNGYRESFFNQGWFFENLTLTIYFWCIAGFFFVFGAIIFSRLKPHFADVL